MLGYTVIDVETTGLVPERTDRIIEIAVVYVSPTGQIEGRWSSLVNPNRDVGPTHIHGIRATDVAPAPTFDQIAPHLLQAVTGRLIVAHNASFDLRFIKSELLRAQVPLLDAALPSLCTMRWSKRLLNSPSAKLVDCCSTCGIDLHHAHSALGDATATAQLLGYLLNSRRAKWPEEIDYARSYPWPSVFSAPQIRLVNRGDQVDPAKWIEAISAGLPVGHGDQGAYLAQLKHALADRFLTELEKRQLIETAQHSGLSRADVHQLHRLFLRAMCEVALSDGVLDEAERAELHQVARVLGQDDHELQRLLTEVAAQPLGWQRSRADLVATGIALHPGDRVVFTGELARSQEVWTQLATDSGLTVGGVTKKTACVVAGDPNSLSGKVKKALEYGRPIITEAAFEKLFSAYVSAHQA